MLLGALMINPTLLVTDKYKLQGEDFSPSIFHRTLFWAINNLALRGATEINGVDIDKFLENYPERYETVQDNNFMDFIDQVKDLNPLGNIDYYYNNVRKFSLVRAYQEDHRDVTMFFDVSKDLEGQRQNLDKYSLSDIMNHYDAKNLEIRKVFDVNNVRKEKVAGVGFHEVKEAFKETPYFGARLQSPYQTALCRGWCRSHLLLRSAPSGMGKTIVSTGDACMVGATHYWDYTEKKFIINHNRQGATLFINTEMDLDTELDTMFVAWISGVSRGHMMDGIYEVGEEERVDEATEILATSEIYLVDDPKFTVKSLYNTIKDYVNNKGVKYVVFDYIQDNGVVGVEMRETHAVVARDTIVLNLTESLKGWAREFNIGIMAMTQLNGKEKINDIIDEDCLSGGKSQKNKIDAGSIMLEPRKKELAQLEKLIDRHGMFVKEPNRISHNYKVRFGAYGTNVKVWQHVDLGTGRVEDLFCTTLFNEPLKVAKPVYEY